MYVCDFSTQPIKAPEAVATIITSESVFYKVRCLFLPRKNTFCSISSCSLNHLCRPDFLFVYHLSLSLYQQGVYYQTGDVIKVTDEEDGKPYYAQIRGFIQDQYCEKSAALTWLIPTQASPKDQFDPGTYIVGEQCEMRTDLWYLYACSLTYFGNWLLICVPGPEEDLPRKMEYLEFVCHAPSEYFKSWSSPFPTIPIRPEKGYIWTHIGATPALAVKESVAGSS